MDSGEAPWIGEELVFDGDAANGGYVEELRPRMIDRIARFSISIIVELRLELVIG